MVGLLGGFRTRSVVRAGRATRYPSAFKGTQNHPYEGFAGRWFAPARARVAPDGRVRCGSCPRHPEEPMATQTYASAADGSVPDIAPGLPILRLSGPVAGVMAVAGEVDIDTAPLFEDRLLELAGSIRLDLRAVTFMDAAGVRALVRTHDHCERGGRSLWVHACSPQVERVLRSLGLYDKLTENEDRGRLVVA
jgi:anti-sigma B factor antagonist